MLQLPPPPAPPVQLEEVVVTAARLPPADADAAFSVIRLDEQLLGRSTRLDEALRTVPAVSLFRRTTSLSANPTTQGISLRAIAPSGAGRTLVTLDGVPMNDPFGGWVIWSQIPTESLSGLDIVRGAGAGCSTPRASGRGSRRASQPGRRGRPSTLFSRGLPAVNSRVPIT